MSLRFLSDQCVPAEITNSLRLHGHEAIRLRDVLPIRSPDETVIAKATELGAILLSLNGDFSDIVAYPPREYLGILAVQLHTHPEIIPKLMERIVEFRPLPDLFSPALRSPIPPRRNLRRRGSIAGNDILT